MDADLSHAPSYLPALVSAAETFEVPIVFVERRHGHSKVSPNVLAESLIMPWRVRFRPPVRPRDD